MPYVRLWLTYVCVAPRVPQDVDVALSNDFISGIALWHFNDFKVDNCGSKWPGPWGGQENNTHCEYDHAPPTTFAALVGIGRAPRIWSHAPC